MSNPFLVQPASYGSQLSGLGQSLQEFGEIKKQRADQEERERLQVQAEQEMQTALDTLEQAYANKDYDTVAKLSIQYPEMSKATLAAIGANEERSQQNIINRGFELLSNPDNFEQIVRDNPIFAEALGGADMLLDDFGNNRDEAIQMTNQFLAHAAGDRYMKYKEALTSGVPEGMTEYQAEMVRQKDTEQDLKRLELEQKRLDRQYKRETDELKRQEIQQKIAINKEKIRKTAKEDADKTADVYAAGQDTLDLIDRIEKHPGFSSYVGAKGISSGFGLLDEPIGGTDAAGVAAMIDTLRSKNFLNSISQMKGMGSLSDAEGKKVAAAVESLDPNMKEEDFRKSLNVIREITERGMKKYREKMSGDQGNPQQTISWSDMK